jgi:hypothetical protein
VEVEVQKVTDISPKVGFAALGAAFATIIWTLVASLSPGAFSEDAIISLTGATGVILAGLLGYACPDPMRRIEPVSPPAVSPPARAGDLNGATAPAGRES